MITIPNVSPATFDALLSKLRQTADVTESPAGYGMMGDFDGHHIEATFVYGGQNQVEITITKKPFLATEGMIADKIRGAIADLAPEDPGGKVW